VCAARFERYVLRTTDVDAATRFYMRVLGHTGDGIETLPARAAALGAPPHWMGFIGVRDDDATTSSSDARREAAERVAQTWLARGATRLGPAGVDGVTLLRDVNGAVQAVAPATEVASASGVLWHQLITPDMPTACQRYAALFGWACTHPSPDADATHRPFAMGPDGPAVGWFSDMAALPGAHPHWLFYFGTPDLDASASAVRALGGQVVDVITQSDGWRLAPCEDQQGAAFGLIQSP
jgi:predicted enzyme related to lactoylglutathione lyase